jgi:anti-sigma28 factor (negative regulator of flagellin synthesis)
MKKAMSLLHDLGDAADRALREEASQQGRKKGKPLSAHVDGVSAKRTSRKTGKSASKDRNPKIDEIKRKISSGFYSSAEALRKIADKIAEDVSDDEPRS